MRSNYRHESKFGINGILHPNEAPAAGRARNSGISGDI